MFAATEKLIHDAFRHQALKTPWASALIYGEQTITYNDLDKLSDKLSIRLKDTDIGSGDIVAIYMDRSPEMIVAMLAILKIGAAYMPLDLTNPVERNRHCLEQADSKLIISDIERNELLDGHRQTLTFTVAELRAGEPGVAPIAEVSAESSAYVMFTSGTTADPKGVVVPHRAVTRLVLNTNYIEISSDDVFLQLSTPSFDAATFEIWGALLNGATLVLYTGAVLDPNLFRDHIISHKITVLWLTAALFHLFVNKYIDALRPLRVLLAGGDVLHPEAVEKVVDNIDGIQLINGYGPTENTTFTCCHIVTRDNKPRSTVPIGTPITGTDIFILDEQMKPVLKGEVGELYAAGAGVALGYLKTDMEHGPFFYDETIASGLIYKTGDLVRVNEQGLLEFIGRTDSQIKLRGYRVSLEEIKARIMEIQGVNEAAVLCHKQEGGDQLLVAYLQTERPDALNTATVRKHLAQVVPRYMIPDKITIGTNLPVNKNGKVDKNQILSTLI